MTLFILIIVFFSYFLATRLISRTFHHLGEKKGVKLYRIQYLVKMINITLFVVVLMLTTVFLGLEYTQISMFISSVFAVMGVALFAQWSILSNMTASLIIFFSFPYRVGDIIKVVDKDADIMGTISEITMFHVIIKQNEQVITYPNSLILQKAVIKINNLDAYHAIEK